MRARWDFTAPWDSGRSVDVRTSMAPGRTLFAAASPFILKPMPVTNLLVVDHPARWQLAAQNVEVVSSRDYLAASRFQRFSSGARVFNLCRSYSYQSIGYYVSLLAEARGHRAIPDVGTLRDFRSVAVVRARGAEIDEIVQSALRSVEADEFVLRIVLGETPMPECEVLARKLYRLFPAPLLRVRFVRRKGVWSICAASPISLHSLTDEERERIRSEVGRFFARRQGDRPTRKKFLYDLALVLDSSETDPPSDSKALAIFSEAAREAGFCVEKITTEDSDRLREFDAVFIRQTTAVDHPIYQLSRLAYAEGLAVIDDPWSILRCTNKIYLHEGLARARIPAPRTWILTREDLRGPRQADLVFPCVLKQPDGSFSRGVSRVDSPEELETELAGMLRSSDLVLVQEYLPSDYDWRIGILDHQPLYACKYFMAQGHWQIYNWASGSEDSRTGMVETIHTELVPRPVIETALRAARLIGDGLYGVDLKQIGDEVRVIEVNDNPSIESGIEDKALGDELYARIARSFRRRVEELRAGV
jgi:glutathione synthase/RimK-type ligase-like ATP-grasp enzyme